MTVVHSLHGGRVVVALKGDLDLTTAKPLRQTLDQLLDRYPGKDLVLDLAEVGFLDSSGLGVILGRYRRLQAEGRRLTLAGVKPGIRAVLDLAGICAIVPVVPASPLGQSR